MFLLTLQIIFIHYINPQSTSLTCLQVKNTDLKGYFIPHNYFRFNLVKIKFNCTKRLLKDSGCIESIQNTSVHIFNSPENIQSLMFERWNKLLFFKYQNNIVKRTKSINEILSSIDSFVNSSNTYIKKTIYKGGKLLVPTKHIIKTKTKVDKRDHIKSGSPINYYLALPINKNETFYYQYVVSKIDNVFKVSEIAITDTFAYICNRRNETIQTKTQLKRFFNFASKHIDVVKKSKRFYLINLKLIQYYNNTINFIQETISTWSKFNNITPYNCKDRIIIDKYLGSLFIYKNAAEQNEKRENNFIKLKNIRLEN